MMKRHRSSGARFALNNHYLNRIPIFRGGRRL